MFFKAPMTVQEHAIATCERLVCTVVNIAPRFSIPIIFFVVNGQIYLHPKRENQRVLTGLECGKFEPVIEWKVCVNLHMENKIE